MAIKVLCRNRLCSWFGNVLDFPDSLVMAPGEQVVCGECGHETMFSGPDRPARNLLFNPGAMNKSVSDRPFEDGSGDFDEQ